jgi:hypothetical protein
VDSAAPHPSLPTLRDAAPLLRALAAKYVWWLSPDEAANRPARVIAQVMELGDHADVQALAACVGESVLADVLRHAEAGQLSPRSWTYWHHRLRLADVGEVPAPPRRRFE